MLKPVQWSEEEFFPDCGGNAEGERWRWASGRIKCSTGISRQDQAELEQMVLDTLTGAEAHEAQTQTMLTHHLPQPLLHPTQSPSRIQSLPQPPIPDIFDTNIPPVEPTLTPPVTLLGLQGEDEPQDPSNIDSQPYEGPSTLNPNSTDDQLQHPSTFPEP